MHVESPPQPPPFDRHGAGGESTGEGGEGSLGGKAGRGSTGQGGEPLRGAQKGRGGHPGPGVATILQPALPSGTSFGGANTL